MPIPTSVSLAGALLVCSAAAQVPSSAPPPAVRAGAFRGVFVDDVDAAGTIWARGTTWKAGLAPSGVTVIPLFGPQAPCNHPLTLRLVEARAGGSAVPLSVGAARRAGSRRVVFDHGSVRERWDLAEDHVEQSFDFAASPGVGDIVLRVAVETGLVASGDGERVVFAAPGLGAVEISDAFAVDASGRRLRLPLPWAARPADCRVTRGFSKPVEPCCGRGPGGPRDSAHRGPRCRPARGAGPGLRPDREPRWDGGCFELRVPGAWLLDASYPVTIDPIIRSVSIDASASDAQFPQLAFDASSDVWLIVYHDVVSQSDFDIVSVRCDGAGTVLDTTFVDVTTAVTTLPVVANNNGANQFLIAWSERVGGVTRIRGRTRTPASTVQGAVFDLTSGGPDGSIALGGASSSGIDRYCLAFVRGNGIASGTLLARTVSTSGALGAEITIQGSSICDAARPRISADCGAAGFWLVTWMEMAAFRCGSPSVKFAAVAHTNALAQVPRLVENLGGGADFNPSVAGNDDQFLIVWERRLSNNPPDADVMGAFVQRVGVAFNRVGAAVDLSLAEPGVDRTLEQLAPSVAFDGCRYAYAYLEDARAQRPFAATLVVGSAGGMLFHEGHVQLSSVPGTDRNVELGARGEHGGSTVRYLAGWDHQPLFGSTLRDVSGAIYDGFNAFGSPRTLATACPSNGAPGLDVSRALLGLPLTARVTGARGAPAVLVGTMAATPIALCTSVRGTCRLGLATILLAQTGAFSQTVPCVPSLMGGRLAFQGVDIGSTLSGGCVPSVFGVPLTVTDTIEVVFQ